MYPRPMIARRLLRSPVVCVLVLALPLACKSSSPSESGKKTPPKPTEPTKPKTPDAAPEVAPSPITGETLQLVIGRSSGWVDPMMTMQRYERGGPEGEWQAVGDPIPASLGHKGMGWGIGEHGFFAPEGLRGPIKAEGDGRSPAGLFRLGAAFGYAAKPPDGTAVDYVQMTDAWRCVDDPKSKRYNAVFAADKVKGAERDWSSAERMRRKDVLYRWGVLVDHNFLELADKRTRKARAVAGSCIFLHVWREPKSPTVGCAAMESDALEELIAWLRPHHEPLIALLPDPQYAKLKKRWRLP